MQDLVLDIIKPLHGIRLDADDARQIIAFINSRTDRGPFIGYQIDFAEHGTMRRVRAAYYRRDSGWVTFKNEDHKVVLDIPESAIRTIERIDPT